MLQTQEHDNKVLRNALDLSQYTCRKQAADLERTETEINDLRKTMVRMGRSNMTASLTSHRTGTPSSCA